MVATIPIKLHYPPSRSMKSRVDLETLFAITALVALVFMFLVSIVFPTLAANNAYADIINDARFEGDIKQIEWIVRILDKGIVWIISIVGFFIIAAAMLRNVLAGAYCAYPRLFDMLAETKVQWKQQGSGSPGGLFKYIISFLIPNIKPLTDFYDSAASPRGYFTKALISGIITVIIGVTIYNGLYRDLIVSGAGLGTHVIENYVLKVDFVKEFDKVLETGRMYSFVWSNSTSEADKQRQSVAKKTYLTVLDAYDTIRSSEARSTTGVNIETELINWFATAEPIVPDGVTAGAPDAYFGHESYKFAYKVTWTQTTMPVPRTPANEGIVKYQHDFTMNQLGAEGADPLSQGDTMVSIIMEFRRVDVNQGEAAISAAEMTIGMNGKGGGTSLNSDTLSLTLGTNTGGVKISTSNNPWYLGTVNGEQVMFQANLQANGQLVLSKLCKAEFAGNTGGMYKAGAKATFGNVANLTGTKWILVSVANASNSGNIQYDGQQVKTINFSSSTGDTTVTCNGQAVPFGTALAKNNTGTAVGGDSPGTAVSGTGNSSSTAS